MNSRLYEFASTIFLMLLALFLGIGLVIAALKRKSPQFDNASYVRAFDLAFGLKEVGR